MVPTRLLCGSPISLDHIRDEATAGRMGQQMMAIVVEGHRNRVYVSPTSNQIAAANAASPMEAWMPSTSLPTKREDFACSGTA